MLQELGFHKCAGAQADLYRLVKPVIAKALNTRTTREAKDILRTMDTLPDDLHSRLVDTKILKSMVDGGERNWGSRSTVKGMAQIQGKLGRYPHNMDPAVYPVPVGRATDIKGTNGRPQNSWLHLRGVNPDAANKSGDRRYRRGF